MNIDKICDVLESGGVVLTPTDTVYGIMGDAFNEETIMKVFDIKKRPLSKPLILLMDSFEMVEEYTDGILEKEKKLIDRFWPGLMTIILKKNDLVSDLITAGYDTVGIRIPNNEELCEIIRRLKRPLFSTSANITGTEVITDTKILEKELLIGIDYVYDGGVIKSKSSTIVRVDDDKLNVLREGELSLEIVKFFNSL